MKLVCLFKKSLLIIFVLISNLALGQYESSILHYDSNNRLVYHSDKDGNRIPDFSHVGYKNGEEALPVVPVVHEIDPITGDNTAHIQAAIDLVSAKGLDGNGHRGALLLGPGEYPMHGVVYIKSSGVVLRGSGEGEDPATNTIIRGVGNNPGNRSLVVIGTDNKARFGGKVSGTTQNITSNYIPVGSRTFEVADASIYSIGDNIIIKHPSTTKWIEAVDYGGVADDDPWIPGQLDMIFNRYITRIEGNKIQVGTPIYNELDRSLSQSFMYVYNGKSQISECGIENMRFFIETAGPLDKDHANVCADFTGVIDSWAKNITALHMGKSGIWLEEATRCTVTDCTVLEPHSVIDGGWRYNFYIGDACNNILVQNCTGSEGRHTFVSNGASTVSGIVFTNCSSTGDHTGSEAHRRWSQGMLWDKISWSSTPSYRVLGLLNRGSYGTGHGWSLTNGVAWNISAPNDQVVIQKPPIGQNYGIGCNATVDNKGPFSHPAGFIEGTGENMLIQSLYQAQLSERMSYGVSPDAPGRLKPTAFRYNDDEKFLSLEWLDIALDENQYILERSVDGGISYEEVVSLAENTETYTDYDIQQENYHYRLKAVNDIGFSAWSNICQASDYIAPDTFDITFQVSMDGLSDLYEDSLVWLSFRGEEKRYIMTDLNGDGIFAVTLRFVEETELEYYFAYQTGADPENDYNRESVSLLCGNSEGYRTLKVAEPNLYQPIYIFETCENTLPKGVDITNIANATVKGSNDDEPWIDGSHGAGSPPGERIEKLIDNDVFTKYLLRAIESWIEIDSKKLSRVHSYTITSANDSPERDPRDWTLQGWDEANSEWITLHTVVKNPHWPGFQSPKTWTFENDQWMSKYRLNIEGINGDAQGLMQMSELEIWGEVIWPLSVNEMEAMSEYMISSYPNPLESSTMINFTLPGESYVKIDIIDLLGRPLENIVDKQMHFGTHEVIWNASEYANGIYLYKISIDDFVSVKSLILRK